MASIQIENLHKSFGSFVAIDNLSLAIEEGKFIALLGPSGCGKSTLLRMLAGLEDISSGKISINNQVVNDLPPKSRDIAMVFQSYALYPHMTVEENMSFSLSIRRVSKDEMAQKVGNAAAILELTPLLKRYPKELSGGQRQRVAMGRAIVRDPAVFLFDEPLSNLDATLRVQMRSEIKQLHQRLKTTMVYVTHDQVEAMSMADVVVVMREGKIEQSGSPLELFDRPANTFVAGFIGSPSMNLLPGKVRRNGQALGVEIQNGQALDVSPQTAASEGQDVIVGLRPQQLEVAASGLETTVVINEPLGTETQLLLELAGERKERIAMLVNGRLDTKPGAKLVVAAARDDIHLFDAKTTQRL